MRVLPMKSITLSLSDETWAKVCQKAFDENQDEVVWLEEEITALLDDWT